MRCPTCHQIYTDKDNMEAIEQIGECVYCDHFCGDIYDLCRGESINIGDNEHTIEVPITEETTEPKGEQIL